MTTDGTYYELERRWKALRATHDVRVREVACVGAARTILCAEIGDTAAPSIALAAGVHGDEPAAVWALLDLVESRALDPQYAYRCWPCTNPTGFQAGTRESADGVDVNRTFGRGGQSPEARAIVTSNRDRKFLLSIDLHEDCDATGFYCYAYGAAELGRRAVEAVLAAGLPVDPQGCLEPNPVAEAEEVGGLSYTLSMNRGASPRALTLETPSGQPWEVRIESHRRAVLAAIGALSQAPHK